MVRASKLFRMGRFNSAEFVTRGNVTVVKIWREGWKKSYYFKVKDLDNTTITPPNYVTNTVSGVVSGEDRILVAPWDGSSTDTNGDPALDKGLRG